jgi:7,8-dihydroneopterin aldolase/epimerase/oxygenase
MKTKPRIRGARDVVWDADHDHVRVMLYNLQVEARVGIHPWEQYPERPNRLIVNVDMFAQLKHGERAPGENIINYDLIRDHIKTWPNRPHTLYLEDLVEELIDLCFQIERVQACRVSITKPDIFNEADEAGIEIYRLRKALKE